MQAHEAHVGCREGWGGGSDGGAEGVCVCVCVWRTVFVPCLVTASETASSWSPMKTCRGGGGEMRSVRGESAEARRRD